MPDPRLILAIEVSNPSASDSAAPGVALARWNPFEPIDSESLRGEGRQDDDLMPAIDRLCARRAVEPRDIGVVALSIGPGGFTGLRVAAVTAKMLALTTGADVVAIPSAEVAVETDPTAGRVGVLLATKRDQAWLALFENGVATEAGPATPEELSRISLDELRADAALPDTYRRAVHCPIRPLRLDPIACARLATIRNPTDPLAISPIYGREPEAVRRWRELHG
ncbi:MAG: tRNA (adenosine(37)-N6)-threonylcarbamoyltransferase complex dimerization subunit type 1 TsaB [Planctomycetota bacterium]